MPTNKIEKTRGWIKDIIYVLVIVVGVFYHFYDKSAENALESANIKQNTEAIQGLTSTIDKLNENMVQDAEFKGGVLQYMKSTDKELQYLKERLP